MFKKLGLLRMLNSSALCSPKDAKTPEHLIWHHRSKRRHGKGGLARSLPPSYQCFLFHLHIKRNSLDPIILPSDKDSQYSSAGGYLGQSCVLPEA